MRKLLLLACLLLPPPTAFADTIQQVNGGGWESFGGFGPAFSVYAGSNVIFDNFGPNHRLGQGGWVVSGSQNTSLWTGNTVQTGASFTSNIAVSLFQIDIALQLDKGTNSFLLSLNENANGVPGITLEEWHITNAAPFGNGSPSFGGFETVTSSGETLLNSGETYWLVASAFDPNSDTDGAWRVHSVPESNTGLLLSIGILASGARCFRKWLTAARLIIQREL